MDYSQRVKRGIELLDRTHPGWDKEIDLNSLDMGNPCRCIFGQLYEWYSKGVTKNNLSTQKSIDKGFTFRSANVTDEKWAALEAAWKEVIIERRMEAEDTWVGAEDKEAELVSV